MLAGTRHEKTSEGRFIRFEPGARCAEGSDEGREIPRCCAGFQVRRRRQWSLGGLDPMIIMVLTGKIIDLNDEPARTYGWSRQEQIGQSIDKLVPEAQRKAFHERFRRCRGHESVRNVECVKVTKTGGDLRGLMTLSFLTDEQGQPEAIALIAKFVST